MVRDFTDAPVDGAVLDRILDASRRVPSAGFAQGTDLVVLVGPTETARYWDATLPADRRAQFRWPGLLRAPVIVVPVTDPSAYLARYAESDKVATAAVAGLGEAPERWPVPYWWVDAGMAVQNLLLAAVDEELAACFFGVFEHEAAIVSSLAIPAGRRPVGVIALGHPADGGGRTGSPNRRPRRDLDDVVHRGGW